jgi:tetratricopeptide (TPR) repeat protein
MIARERCQRHCQCVQSLRESLAVGARDLTFVHRGVRGIVAGAALAAALMSAMGLSQAPLSADALQHTDPINADKDVREAHTLFYNLDYDRALNLFETVQRAHPQSAMAMDYVLMVLIFRELYHQDLLDTTYYAHDSFLSAKRSVAIPDATRQRIESTTDAAIALCDQQLKANPNDKNALFSRGYARGMHAAFITLADHSYIAAARQGLASRNDSEQVLKLDPNYQDAKMAVGIQQFAVASLPRLVRMMVGIAGVGGSKEKGIDLLRQAAAGGIVTRVETRTALSLFLRHDGRYPEALAVEHELAQEFPRDYLFRLEEANLTKDQGNGPGAIATYRAVLADARRPGYFVDPRLQMAWFGLADTERGQNDITDAAKHYLEASEQPNCSEWIRKRANLNAGEMLDLLHDRRGAMKQYQLAAAGGVDETQADAAKRYMKTPYTGK